MDNDAPRLQLALDMADLGQALEVAEKTKEHIDVVEVGTILCAAQGMVAVSQLRTRFPDKELLADMRIARAGAKLANMAFEAGADVVTCVAEAPVETLAAAAAVAREAGKKVRVELGGDWAINAVDAQRWRKEAIDGVICHHGSEVAKSDGGGWGETARELVRKVAAEGFTVTIAGGIGPATAGKIRGLPVDKVVCGKAIWGAADPAAAARQVAGILSHQATA